MCVEQSGKMKDIPYGEFIQTVWRNIDISCFTNLVLFHVPR